MSAVTTTIKTETCSFSEYKVYPGRGVRFVTKEGKVHLFINSKTESLFHQRVKPARLTWAQAWRRMNKKIRSDEGMTKRRTRRTNKLQKAIVGLSLDDLVKKRNAIKKPVTGTKAAAAKEARARQAAAKQDKVTGKKAFISVTKTVQPKHLPKNQPRAAKQQTASSRR